MNGSIKIKCRGFYGYLLRIDEIDALYYNNETGALFYDVEIRFNGESGSRGDMVRLTYVRADEIEFITEKETNEHEQT